LFRFNNSFGTLEDELLPIVTSANADR